MSEETTTEQLAEIEGQAEDTPATEYTPPEGWRVLAVGELLQPGDHWVSWEVTVSRLDIQHGDGATVSGGRYIRQIKPQPQPEPQPESEPDAATIEELRSEVSYVQNLLGTEKRRVVELEELVTSLQRELAVAKEELKIAAAVSHQLQIELDAAQQVPADSPELQQLRLRLADMTLDRDTCKDAYDRIFADLVTIRETTAADTVEAIIEWLEPFRGCNSPALALLLLEALPHIMRSLTGLADEEIE